MNTERLVHLLTADSQVRGFISDPDLIDRHLDLQVELRKAKIEVVILSPETAVLPADLTRILNECSGKLCIIHNANLLYGHHENVSVLVAALHRMDLRLLLLSRQPAPTPIANRCIRIASML